MSNIYNENIAETGHSAHYHIILKFFKEGFWDEQKVRNLVAKGKLTETEFKAITGVVYHIPMY